MRIVIICKMNDRDASPTAHRGPVPKIATGPKQLQVKQLLDGARSVQLFWQGEAYTLRVTRNDKLILTK